MKKLLILTFVMLAQGISIAAELSSHAAISPKAKESLLLDIESVGNEFIVAVGERGHILRSVNGENWEQMPVPTQITLTSVDFVNSRVGWAVGHNSTILKTTDAGFSWQVQYSSPESQIPFLDVSFKDENNGVAVGAYGLFFRTIDGGQTWQQEFHLSLLAQEDLDYLEELKQEDELAYIDERGRILPHFNGFYQDGRTVYLLGEVGLIAKSNDYGQNWQRLEQIYHGSFYDLARTQRGNLLTVGLRGNVFRSLTNGTPWTHSPVESTALLNDIVLYGDNIIFILGNNGLLLKSTDDGQTFEYNIQSDGKALIAGAVFNDKLIISSEVGIKVLQVEK